MRHAIVENGIVVNVAEASEDVGIDRGWVASETAQMGWLYDGETFSPPPEPEPTVPIAVSMRQARLALLGAGVLSQVDGAIDNLPEPDRTAAQIEWEYATELRRDHPLVTHLGAALDLDDEAIDALFMQAAQIV